MHRYKYVYISIQILYIHIHIHTYIYIHIDIYLYTYIYLLGSPSRLERYEGISCELRARCPHFFGCKMVELPFGFGT